MNETPHTVVSIGALTSVGQIREHNEDDFIIIPDVIDTETREGENSFVLGQGGCFLVVADGMGGAAAGEVASQSTTKFIKKFLAANKYSYPSPNEIKHVFEQIIVQSHQNLQLIIQQHPEYKGMGTTIVMAWVIDYTAYICWVGDSRCYHYRPQRGTIVATEDHSWVMEMVKKGHLSPEEAANHEYRNIITQCLGDSQSPPKPDFVSINLEKGDKILLCSDGLNTMISDADINWHLSQTVNISLTLQQLINSANQAGGEDNVTVAILEFLEKPLRENRRPNRSVWEKLTSIFK
jgi:protein phosphatase